ncbi:MAG: OsmC family protein [Balneolales bacterium]|nr:OsmC family protein [Balneolales bacterium]
MNVKIKRIDNDFHMEAVNDTGNIVHMDGNPAIGGHNLGVRPMQMLLMGVGGCSSIDIISILRKQRVELDSIEIEVNGERDPKEVPALFKKIHLTFILGGVDVSDQSKALKAAQLSMDKYCSVSKMIEAVAEITYDVQFLPPEY